MIDLEEMKNACNKNVNILFVDGEVWENKKCTNFYVKDENDEENMLEFDDTIVYQSEIKSIEIID